VQVTGDWSAFESQNASSERSTGRRPSGKTASKPHLYSETPSGSVRRWMSRYVSGVTISYAPSVSRLDDLRGGCSASSPPVRVHVFVRLGIADAHEHVGGQSQVHPTSTCEAQVVAIAPPSGYRMADRQQCCASDGQSAFVAHGVAAPGPEGRS